MTMRFVPTHWREYALLDAGHGKRLERFGEVTTVSARPVRALGAGRRRVAVAHRRRHV